MAHHVLVDRPRIKRPPGRAGAAPIEAETPGVGGGSARCYLKSSLCVPVRMNAAAPLGPRLSSMR